MKPFKLTEPQAVRLRKLVRLYPKPKMEKSWKRRTPDELWLRTLSQIVVAGNAGPGDTLRHSLAVRERLAFSLLKKLPIRLRRERIHDVLQAIGTRYVGKKTPNRKVEAALRNFETLAGAGGPKKFFEVVAALPTESERIQFLSNGKKTLQYYGKKGARDTLIDLGLAKGCLALDARILGLLGKLGARINKRSLNRNYESIEKELIEKVAKQSDLSGGQLDRILFNNSGDIMVRLLCP